MTNLVSELWTEYTVYNVHITYNYSVSNLNCYDAHRVMLLDTDTFTEV